MTWKAVNKQMDTQCNRGEGRSMSEKIMWGFSIIIASVLLLLLPLMLFSSDSSALVSNPVTGTTMSVTLTVSGEPLELYSFTNSGNVHAVSREEYAVWQTMFKGGFLSVG